MVALHYNENKGRKQAVTKEGTNRCAVQYLKYMKGGYIVRKWVEDSIFFVEEYLLHQMVYIHAASCKHLLLSLQVTLRIYLVKVIVLLKIHKLQQRPA